MVIIPTLVLLASPEAVSLANKLALSHQKMTSGAVLVSDGLSHVIPTRIRFAPGVCTIVMPNQQIAEAHPNAVRYYDQIFHQVATAKPQNAMKIPDGVSNVAIIHREPIAWLLNAKQRDTFFTEIKRDPRWKVKAGKLELVDSAKKFRSEVMFDTSYRVTEIRLNLNGKVITDWQYKYVPATQVVGIPANAKVVRGLPARPNIPAKTNPNAVALAQKVWMSMSRLDGRTVIQTNQEGTFKLSVKSAGLLEQGPKGSWNLSGTSLSLTPKNGAPKQFKGGVNTFADKLHSAGLDASPFAYYFLNRQVPYLDLFDQCTSLDLEGSIGMQGNQCKILTVIRNNTRIRLYVEEKTGDLLMISSDSVDSKGSVVNSSRLKITYQ